MIRKKFFYSHLVNLNDLIKEVDRLNLEIAERDEILDIIEDIFHHRILDELINTLPTHLHKEFLEILEENVEDIRLIDYLKQKATYDPEIKVITITEVVKKEILLDVYLAKPKKRIKKSDD